MYVFPWRLITAWFYLEEEGALLMSICEPLSRDAEMPSVACVPSTRVPPWPTLGWSRRTVHAVFPQSYDAYYIRRYILRPYYVCSTAQIGRQLYRALDTGRESRNVYLQDKRAKILLRGLFHSSDAVARTAYLNRWHQRGKSLPGP